LPHLPASAYFEIIGLIGLGWLDIWKVPFDSSLSVFRRGLEGGIANGDSVAQAEGYTVVGFLESRLIGPNAGVARLENALAILPASQRALQGAIRCVLGPILSFGGRATAEAEARKGLELAREVSDIRLQGICYQSLANVLIATSQEIVHAERLLDSAEVAHRAAHDHDMLAVTLFTKGYNRLGTFDLAAAKRDLLAALADPEGQADPQLPPSEQSDVAEEMFELLDQFIQVTDSTDRRAILAFIRDRVAKQRP